MEILQYSNNKILINFNRVRFRINKSEITNWLYEVAKSEGLLINGISITFCTDEFLLEMNQHYLGHNYYTDIITFNISDDIGKINGDLYISSERVRNNAAELKIKFSTELERVIVHGLLHLCGYKDKTKKAVKLMREKEEFYLKALNISRETIKI